MLKYLLRAIAVACFGLVTVPALAQVQIQIANEGVTGTTLGKLAKLTGAPSSAIIAATADTGGAIGVVVGWSASSGTTGNALIARAGVASCIFDGATTANDYVQISPTVAGDCHDAGATYPQTGQVLGRVLTTNVGTGTYSMTIAGAEIQASLQAGVADQTIAGGANVTALTQSAGNITVDCGLRPEQYMANSGAFTITAPASDGHCILDVENGASAGAVSVSGFAPNSIGGVTLDTTNGHNFRLFISRNHAHSSIYAVALQ